MRGIREWLEDWVIQGWLSTLGWAAGVTLVVLVIGALSASASNRAAAPAVAIALGFAAAFVFAAGGVPALPPRERWHWSLWITVASLLLLFLEEVKGGQATMRLVLQVALVAALVWLVLKPSGVAAQWTPRVQKLCIYGGTIGGVLFLVLAELQARASPPWRTLVPFALTAIATTAVFVEHWERGGRMTAGLAASMAVCGVVELVQRDVPLGRTVVTTATLALGSLLLSFWAGRYVSGARALLLAVAWSTALIPLPRKSPWLQLALATLLAAIPAALAWKPLF